VYRAEGEREKKKKREREIFIQSVQIINKLKKKSISQDLYSILKM